MTIMKKFLIAAMLSLSLITPSFAAEDTPKEPVVNEDVTNLAKQLADMIYLLESFGKKVETEFENFSKEFDKELEKKRKEDK